MNLTNEFESIREWAKEKGILQSGDVKTQSLKLTEEVGELAKAVIECKPDEIKDAIGDIVVVITSLAALAGLSIEECVNAAYAEIKDRRGIMVNNTFKRDKVFPDETKKQ